LHIKLKLDVPSPLRGNPPAAGALAWIAVAVWLLGTAGAFWFFELRDWRPFAAQSVRLFEIDGALQTQLWFRTHIGVDAPASGNARLTFVHLYNPDCRCDAYTEQHLQRLMSRYQSRGVRFVAALTPLFANRPTPAHPLGLRVVASTDGYLAAAGVNTAPAALIFDAAGRLIYYGPFSDSAWCGSDGGLVEPVLDRALAGRAPIGAVPVVRGCFCAW
jgi:hypothetical protein